MENEVMENIKTLLYSLYNECIDIDNNKENITIKQLEEFPKQISDKLLNIISEFETTYDIRIGYYH